MIEYADRLRPRARSRAELVAELAQHLRAQLARSRRRACAAAVRAAALRCGAWNAREDRAAQAASVCLRVAMDEADRDAKSLGVLRAYAKRHGLRV